MNKDLDEIIKTYAIKTHKDISNLLLDKSKNNIISILIDLLTVYFNDKNSSTLREYILVTLSDFIPNQEKIGYNGYKQKGLKGKHQFCEAKPKNINTNDKIIKKLNGGGNFTDYTFARFDRDKKTNPLMLIGGFIDGKLIFIVKFPFKSKNFTDKLQFLLLKRFPKGKDIPTEFLRSATFSLNDYKYIKNIDIKIYVSKDNLGKYKNYITKPLYSFLEKSYE